MCFFMVSMPDMLYAKGKLFSATLILLDAYAPSHIPQFDVIGQNVLLPATIKSEIGMIFSCREAHF
ncbi:hypothetical protein KSX_17360 [Ktedonospora formicarum]|uniref:Uncharacterized protein n=1 Tax=Ktedonospora formicarum TaxID=2778364 RepID=A0A8J3MRF4_9CHLR|nr:hypothetical protein KSX_17360 [Ktedonospora formicarum]